MRTIEAEHVIVTVPLGVLKEEYENLFVHPLPERKVNAIKNMSFGSVNQVFLTFEKQWWPNNTNFFVIWNDDDIQKLEVFLAFIFLNKKLLTTVLGLG